MNSYISSIGTSTPKNRILQSELSDFMADAHNMNANERKRLGALYRATGIRSRYSVLDDFKGSGVRLFSANGNRQAIPGVGRRMNVFKEEAVELAVAAVSDCVTGIPDLSLQHVSHLVTVSCTGMYAPGLDIDLIERLGLNTSIQRTAINYMGCYAALTAIKMADSICQADPHSCVLIVCVELCSIHFQKGKTEDNILVQALFGDGAAAMVMNSHPRTELSLKAESTFCDLMPEGKSDMAWGIDDLGFQMRLSSHVPDILRKGIRCLTQYLLQSMKLNQEEVSYYAIHPGGKKILEVVEEELELPKDRNWHSRQILAQYGNMSSPTILFILKSIWQDLSQDDRDKRILSLAFGPGLALESMLLRIEIH